MWRNFQFPHNCHTWKAEIFPHDNLFSTNSISDICDKVCESRSGLAKHMRATHPGSCCVACEYCGRVLADQDTYTRHLNNMHHIQV